MCRISNQYILHASDIDHHLQDIFVQVLVTFMNGDLNKYSIQHVTRSFRKNSYHGDLRVTIVIGHLYVHSNETFH